jgi:archaellum component FlaF (FlaF/FlaG flagellin family)
MKISLLPVVAAALAFSGCVVRFNSSHSSHNTTVSRSGLTPAVSQDQMVFRYTNYNGKAVLESDRVVLVFDGISRDEQRAFHFGGNAQAIQISGNGVSGVDVSCRRNVAFLRFHSDYANGTNTLQFGKQVVQFVDNGQLLLAGKESVALTNGQTRVHLNRKGEIIQEH